MEGWGTQFARTVGQRAEGQSDFALDLIDLLEQKAAEFNSEAPKGFKFALNVTPKGEDVVVTNGYKSVAVLAGSLPGAIFVRVTHHGLDRVFEATLHNSPGGFEPDGIPKECADPDGLAEWMIHELFEP